MTTAQPSLFARDDTFLGVCEGIGQDFGFNPLWLRMALGVSLLWNPVAVISVYLGLGVIVAISRWVFPSRGATVTEAVQPKATVAPTLRAQNDAAPFEVAAAA